MINIYEVAKGDIDRIKKGYSLLYNRSQLGIIYQTLTDSSPIKDMSFAERKARAKAIEELLDLPHQELQITHEMTLNQVKKTYKKK